MVGKYMAGIPDDTHSGFITKLQTDMTGLVMGAYAKLCRDDWPSPETFIEGWTAMTIEQRRQQVRQVWSMAEFHYTEDAIDKVLNFSFADFTF
jgi:hypothetical protein